MIGEFQEQRDDEPESQEQEPEVEKREEGETRPLFEVTEEQSRLMEYGREDLENEAIRGLMEAERESGLSQEEIERARKETGVLEDLAEVQADAEAAEVDVKDKVGVGILDQDNSDEPKTNWAESGKAKMPVKETDLNKELNEQTRPRGPMKLSERFKREAERRMELDEEIAGVKSEAGGEARKPFSAETELQDIRRARSGDRKEMLREWKERFASHRIDLAIVQEEIIDAIRKNPDAFADKGARISMLKVMDARYNLSNRELGEIIRKIDFYNDKHVAVRKFRENHPDDEELYFAAFGRPPSGKIEVIEGPMTLYFRCHDERDYALIHSQKFLANQDIEDKDIEKARTSGGTSIGRALAPELEGTIIAENAKGLPFEGYAKTVLIHEEQHAINRLFERMRGNFRSGFKKFLASETPEDRDRSLRDYFRDIRDGNLARAKEEVIAYFKDGNRPPQEIFSTLTKTHEENGIYDYFKEEYFSEEGNIGLREFVAGKLGGEDRVPEKFGEIRQEVFRQEYGTILAEAIASYIEFKNRGFSDDKIAAIFLQEPLTKWKKTANRLLKTVPLKDKEEGGEGKENRQSSKPISSEGIRSLALLNFKKGAGLNLDESEEILLNSETDRLHNEAEELLGRYFSPEEILKKDEELEIKIAFLEKWNSLSDDEQVQRLARFDQLMERADLSEEEIEKKRQEIKSSRERNSDIVARRIKNIKSSEPLTEEEGVEYIRLHNELTNLPDEENDSDRIKRRIFRIPDSRKLEGFTYRITLEKENLLGPGAPMSGNRFLSMHSRQDTEAYLEFLKQWREKNPQEREVALKRLEKLKSMT